MAAARQALVLLQSVKYREKNLTSNQLLKFLTLKDSFVSFYRIMFCFWIRSVAGARQPADKPAKLKTDAGKR